MPDNHNKKNRIAVIGLKGLPAFGGAATVGQNVIEKLNRKFCFTVFSVETHADRDFKMPFVEQYIFKKYPIKKINVFIYYLKSAFYVLLNKRFDLIHLHHTDGAFILPILRLRYRVVITSHAIPQDNSKWSYWVRLFFKLNERLAFRYANAFTVVAKTLQEHYHAKYKKNVKYIPNGVGFEVLNSLKGGIDRPSENYILFAAGRIIPLKGLHLLLKALEKIGFDGKLIVAGDINQMEDYKAEIVTLSKSINVEFVGLIKEKGVLLNLVRNADFFVFPSLTEAMSIMLLETALMKTPIICSDIPANKAVFNSDEVLFFKSGDYDDLANVISYALKDEKLLGDNATRAHKKLELYYNWRKIAVEYGRVYEGVLR